MARRWTGRGFVVGACLLTFLSAGCTPDAPPADPPSSSAPSPTPSENAQEREERLAYEAAEKSYREFRAEYYRVLSQGGSKSSTPAMKATAAGPYLREATEVVQAYRGLNRRAEGTLNITNVRGNGYAPADLVLTACEDSSGVAYFDKKGKTTGRGELRQVELTVREVSGRWKVWSGTGSEVTSCAE